MKVRQHIPNFVSGVDPAQCEAANLAELRALPFVASWETEPDFKRWEESDGHLMAIVGEKYWVAAYLENPALYGLPKWVWPGPH